MSRKRLRSGLSAIGTVYLLQHFQVDDLRAIDPDNVWRNRMREAPSNPSYSAAEHGNQTVAGRKALTTHAPMKLMIDWVAYQRRLKWTGRIVFPLVLAVASEGSWLTLPA